MKLNSRTVLAGAVLALMGGMASAATITVTGQPVKYSKEGLALAGGNVTLPAITVVLGQNYTYQDDIIISLNGGAALPSPNTPPTILCGGTAVVGFVQQLDASTYNFRVTDQTGITTGTSCTITNLQATAASIGSSSAFGVSWTAKRFVTGQIFDEAATASTALTAANQLKVTAGGTGLKLLDAVIDVDTKRVLFTPGNDTTTTDVLNTTITQNATSGSFTAPVVNVSKNTMSIFGDFSWTDSNDTGTTCQLTELQAAVAVTAGYVVSGGDCSKVIITSTAASPLPDATPAVTITIPGTKALSPQVFTGTLKFDYTLAGGTTSASREDSFGPGSWSINGALIYINYMPYDGEGGDISRIVYLSNRGTQSGTIELTVFQESGGNPCSFSGGTLGAGQVKKLSGTIDQNVYQCFGADYAGKVHMIITVDAPRNDVESYSAYNVGGSDRGTVVNTSNGRIVLGGNSN